MANNHTFGKKKNKELIVVEITLVKNPARRKSAKRRKAARNPSKKAKSAKRSAAAKKAWRTRRRNAAAKARKANPSKRKKSAKRKNSRRKNPAMANVMKKPVQSMPIIGDMKIAKKADSEIAIDAHGAQKWKSAGLAQKSVMTVGGLTGYGYGASFAQMGQELADNVIVSSAAGVVTGVGGLAASSYLVNKVGGDMLFSKHEKKNHTFANFTKGWKYGGYIAVGLNTATNLLTAVYGRSYSGLSGWNGIMSEMKYDTVSALKKAAMMSTGAHKLSHIPAVAGFMYETNPDGPLQGFAFGQNLAGDADGMPGHGHGDKYITEEGGYYADDNDALGYVDVMGRTANPIGYVDVMGYPSGVGYPAEFAENQPLYG